MSRPPVRLYVDAPLSLGASLALEPAASHYLCTVMRHTAGDMIEIFNGRDGAWAARITEAHRKHCTLAIHAQTAQQERPPDLWLLCAPLKKERLNWMAEKACELGVAHFMPVETARSLRERLNPDRLRAHMIEAAEQCGRTHVPEIAPLVTIDTLLGSWPENRLLLFCDENGGAEMAAVLDTHPCPSSAIIIGPEGGFTPEERTALRGHPAAVPITLGDNILRADTAAVAAIAIWQSWRRKQ